MEICKHSYARLNKLFDHHDLAKLPEFLESKKLSSILGTARLATKFEKYDVVDLAVYYLVKIARRHPFSDGNKRSAVIFFLTYLYFEGYVTTINQFALYELTIMIVKADLNESDLIIATSKLLKDEKLIEQLH